MSKNKVFSYGKWVATNFGSKRNVRINILQNYLNRNYPIDNELDNGLQVLKKSIKNIYIHRNT